MKNLIHQFYNEGFATTFYQKPKKFIKRHIKNEFLQKILISLLLVLYTVIIIAVALFIFYTKIK